MRKCMHYLRKDTNLPENLQIYDKKVTNFLEKSHKVYKCNKAQIHKKSHIIMREKSQIYGKSQNYKRKVTYLRKRINELMIKKSQIYKNKSHKFMIKSCLYIRAVLKDERRRAFYEALYADRFKKILIDKLHFSCMFFKVVNVLHLK